jgi:hypothetical protein
MTDSTTVELLVVFQPDSDEEFVRLEGEDREATLSEREFLELAGLVGMALVEYFADDDGGDDYRIDDTLG